MDLGLKGKIALVAASSKGIGRASAAELAAEGCTVICCARHEKELADTVAEISATTSQKVLGYVTDLTKIEEIERLVEQTRRDAGPIDILVNNCGGPVPGTFATLKESDWEAAYHSTLMPTIRLTRAVLSDMQRQKWGRVINITSVSVRQPVDGLMLSNAFRAGVVGFAKTLSNEVGPDNITVNTVAPGFTLTGRLTELFDNRAKQSGKTRQELMAQLAATLPLRRFATPDEIANVVVFLASIQAGYITGVVIPVDGGSVKGL